MQYTIQRLGDPRTVSANTDQQIDAESPIAAVRASGMATAGAQIVASTATASHRYTIDSIGRITEQSSYKA